jgi:tripartite-type tricarboxylate transporter receptor subunit TctC
MSRTATAQDYPVRPVRWIVSFAAGGPNDIVARIVGQYLSDHLGQQFVIENRAGAAGNVGMQSALSSAPDGYTIAFVGPNYAINPALYEKLPFDFIRDSVPVAGIMRLANVMDVNPAFPANNLAEFIAYAKANPGKINFGSGGVGTSPHLSAKETKREAPAVVGPGLSCADVSPRFWQIVMAGKVPRSPRFRQQPRIRKDARVTFLPTLAGQR